MKYDYTLVSVYEREIECSFFETRQQAVDAMYEALVKSLDYETTVAEVKTGLEVMEELCLSQHGVDAPDCNYWIDDIQGVAWSNSYGSERDWKIVKIPEIGTETSTLTSESAGTDKNE